MASLWLRVFSFLLIDDQMCVAKPLDATHIFFFFFLFSFTCFLRLSFFLFSMYSLPRFKDGHGFFFRASLTRGIVFKIPGTVTRLPRGQRRRNLRLKTRHCSRNIGMSRKRRKSDHDTAAGRWLKVSFFVGSESGPPLDLPYCTTVVLRKEWCC